MSHVQARMALGFGFICATCDHFRETGCGMDCAGPIRGRDFPSYAGPVLSLDRWCFVCGADSTCTVTHGSGRPVGCCDTHARIVSEYEPARGTRGR